VFPTPKSPSAFFIRASALAARDASSSGIITFFSDFPEISRLVGKFRGIDGLPGFRICHKDASNILGLDLREGEKTSRSGDQSPGPFEIAAAAKSPSGG